MLIGMRNAILAGGAKLPYDAEVEYIESTGTQWIDTGVVGTSALEVDIRIYSPNQAGNSKCPIGNFDNSTGVVIRDSLLVNSNAKYYYYFGSLLGTQGNYIPFNQWIKFTLGLSAKWKGETSGEGTYMPPFSGAFSTTVSLTLFCRHVNNNSSIYTDAAWTGKISHCAINEGSRLVRDFIPVRFTNENGVTEGAMLDRVSGALFRNAGTGAFIIGPDASAANGGGISANA